MFDDLSVFYSDFGTEVSRESGAFRALFSHAPADTFDLTRSTEITLRWPAASATLGEGDEIVANGQRYRLAEPPQEINAHERTARLTQLGAA